MDDFGRTLNIHVAGCAESHQRLLQSLDSLTDDQCREPSALPGWTRGHVLSHLARNAESHVHVLQCAARGEVGEQYVGGYDNRARVRSLGYPVIGGIKSVSEEAFAAVFIELPI